MAVIKVTKNELSGGSCSRGSKRDAKIPYIVELDAPPTNIVDLETADDGTTAVAAIGAELNGDSTRRCTKIEVSPANQSKLLYDVVCSFETVDPGWDENPLLRKDVYRFEGSKETESVFMTVEDTPKPIVTPAGEPFEKLAERTTGAFKITIDGYRELEEAPTLATTIAQYLRPNAVNDGNVTVRGITFLAGQLKLVDASIEPVVENGVACLKCRWECEVAPDFDLHLDARGYWERIDPDDEDAGICRIVTGNPPQRVTKPYPLLENGLAAATADAEPAHLTFKIQPRKDLSAFNWTTAA